MKSSRQDRTSGIFYSLSAGILWGIVPVYIYIIDAEDPYEIVAHRSIWSAALLLLMCWIWGHLDDIWAMLKTNRNFYKFFLTASLLSLNWGIYVYSVQTEQVVAAALGYFIYPLCTVMLGIIVLGETLDRWAGLAIGLVCFGVVVKAMTIMNVPWVSLALAGTFSLYAVLRKRMEFDPIQGLFVETMLVLPFALAFLIWMAMNGQVLFFGGGLTNVLLAMFAGIITVVPLIFFHRGNQLLSLTMASLLFYSNPTAQLLLGAVAFSEQFLVNDLIAFGLIWIGIAVYFMSRRRVARRMIAGS
ncbi:MAG: EamA family transporter RarD [Candidatus Puniceispirillaceae bacterium]